MATLWQTSRRLRWAGLTDRRATAAPDENAVLGRRDRAILVFLYTADLRAGDVCRLTIGSIDWEGEILRVAGSF